MFNRFDSTGLTETVVEVRMQSVFQQAVAAAMRNNIVLPTVVIVGREHSRNHANGQDILDDEGRRLTLEDRKRIAEARRHLLEQEKPDFRTAAGPAASGEQVPLDKHLPKAFRVIKPKELDIEEIYERHQFKP
jgi:hypothetical protein